MRMLSRTMTTLGMKEYHLVMQAGTHGGYHLADLHHDNRETPVQQKPSGTNGYSMT